MISELNNNLHAMDKLNPNLGRASEKTIVNPKNVPSFTDTMKGFMKDVNHMQNHADRSIEKMVAGEITDVHQVMVSVEEANTAFALMMELRNKMLESYQEVMRMQV